MEDIPISMSPIPLNELNKWCGLSYLDQQYKENVRLAFIFNDASALVTTDDEFYMVGRNEHGSLATGTDQPFITKVPTRVEALCGKRIVDFAFGAQKIVTTPKRKCFRLSLFAVSQDGSVYGWGNNCHGNLGLRYNSPQPVSPTRIVFSTTRRVSIVQLACGAGHSVALDRDGQVWGWGRNFYGQVGDGISRQDHTFPVPIRVGEDDGINTISVACGRTFSVALLADGKVWSWGQNTSGQLGFEVEEGFSLVPRQVCFSPDMDIPITKITCGKHHTLALTRDGTIWAWGRNDHGQLGQDSALERSFSPLLINVTGIKDIAAVPHLSVSVCKSDEHVYMWGKLPEPTGKSICDPWDTFMNSIPDVFSSFVHPTATCRPISCQTTYHYSNAKIHFPELVKWSALKFIDPGFLQDLKVAFVCGTGFEQSAILVTNTHDVLFVGKSVHGSLGTGNATVFETRLPIKNKYLSGKDICSFSFGLDVEGGIMCLFALTDSGQIWSWAYNEYGELGIGKKSEGTVAVIPTRVGGALKNVKVAKIISGSDHTFAITTEGVMYGFGYNCFGQVGVGHCDDALSPLKVKFKGKETKIVSAAAGMLHSVAVTTEGHVYAWGANKKDRSQLGCVTPDEYSSFPVRVKFPLGVRIEKVCCGPDCTFAISSRGHLYFWGYCPFQENVAASPIRVCTDIQEQIIEVGTAHWSSINAFQTRSGRVYVWGKIKGQADVVKKPVENFRVTSIDDVFAFLSNPPCMINPLVSQPPLAVNELDNLLNGNY